MKNNRILSCFLVVCCIVSLCSCNNTKTEKADYVYNIHNGVDYSVDDYFDYYSYLNSSETPETSDVTSTTSSEEEKVTVKEPIKVKTDAPFVKWETTKLVAPGKAFTLPNIKQSGDSAPVAATLTKQVYPGDSITVMGKGFETSGTAAYYVADGNTKKASMQLVNDTQVAVTISKTENYGVYGIYLKNDNGTSAIKMVNVPSVWWIDYTDVNAGNEISIYGENLTYNNENTSNVYLLDGEKWFKMNVISADPHKVTVQIPQGLIPEKQYSLKLHNGHGGEYAWADVEQKITFKEYVINAVKSNVINVVDYGARPDNAEKNSTRAIYSAVQAADVGDTIYFPAGTYLMKSGITVDKSLKFVGDGSDKTKIIMYDKISDNPGALLTFKGGPIEISGIGFEDVRSKKFTNYFIKYMGDGNLNGNYNLYIHDCSFLQDCKKKLSTHIASICAENATNIWIKNNKFETTGVMFANKTKNVIVTDNEICGVSNVFGSAGTYHPNQLLVWDTHNFDFSKNKVYSKDLITDPNGTLEYGDKSNGRTISFQLSNSNIYVADNNLERVGLPGDNAGEQFLFEDTVCVYDGYLSNPTANTLDLLFEPYSNITTKTVVMITEGTGVGQYRYVESHKNKTLTVDKDWEIKPDSTSRIILFKSFSNVAVYKNTVTGFKNHNTKYCFSSGTCLYGNMVNGFITNNDFSDLPYGMSIVAHYRKATDDTVGNGNASQTSGFYWIQCDYNKIKNCSVGFNYSIETMFREQSNYTTYTSSNMEDYETPTNLTLGFIFRGNNIDTMSDYLSEDRAGLGGIGILVGSMDWRTWQHPQHTCNGGWMQGTLIENNSIKGCAKNNIVLCKHQGNTILSGNNYSGTYWGVDPSMNKANHISTAVITPPIEYVKSGS